MKHEIKRLNEYEDSYELTIAEDINSLIRKEFWCPDKIFPVWCFQFHEIIRNNPDWWYLHVNYPFMAVDMVLSGTLVYDHSGYTTYVHPGEVFICVPGTTSRMSVGAQGELHTLALLFRGPLVLSIAATLGFSDGMLIRPADSSMIEKKMRVFEPLLKRKESGTERKVSLMTYELIITLSEWIDTKIRESGIQNAVKNFLASPACEETQMTLAKKAGCSLASFRKKFTRLYGMPPATWITRQKMRYVSVLLREKRMSVNEASVLCGYSDPRCFSNAFKRLYGMAPRKFLKNTIRLDET